MRRLPVYFVLDVSESMVGENHVKLEDGLRLIVRELRQNPHALESVYLSVIAFAGKARTLVPLVELIDFNPPELPIGRGTDIGGALQHLMREIDKNSRPASATHKGDWKPLVFLMTDGHPTADARAAVAKWTSGYRLRAAVIAISIGTDADIQLLSQITDDVLVFEETEASSLINVIKWISQSIQVHSRALDTNDAAPSTKPDTAGLKTVNLSKAQQPSGNVDDRFAIIVGQCQTRRLPYILKYERTDGGVKTSDQKLEQFFNKGRYQLSAVQALRQSFFDMSADDGANASTISIDLLDGGSSCPHCSNRISFTICDCGNIFCCSGAGRQTCPWCNSAADVVGVDADTTETAIRRSQG